MSYTQTELYLLQRLKELKVSYSTMAEILGLLQTEDQQWKLMDHAKFGITEAELLEKAEQIASK